MKFWIAAFLPFAFAASGEKAVRPEQFFRKGIIGYRVTTAYPANSWSSESTLTIGAVTRNSSGSLTCTGLYEQYSDGEKSELVYGFGYACDALNFYANTTNWCWPWYGDDAHVKFRCSGDSIIYPLNMKMGDTLPSAHANRSMDKPHFHATDSVVIVNRVVDGRDTLQTSIGEIAAWRITSEMNDYPTLFGEPARHRVFIITEWFSPAWGVIKRVESEDSETKTIVMISFNTTSDQ